ncbi:MAG: GGDEF domain-containing protein [Desulfopila sp.]|jgi:diguanylate cyclase (GGDEF)-like protein|nr:GGDEF domain-containing protein [Desulfopila sp.]
MKNTVPRQVTEFINAARKPYSFDILHNLYIWFGFLWGLPIPIVTLLFEMNTLKSAGLEHSFVTSITSPVQWFFLAHPILFGILFGILGTIRNEKDQELDEKIQELKDLTVHDPLTGLKNRRYFAHMFHDECARSLRRNESLTLLFLDIDHFKKINDTHGHHFGDVVLKELGAYLLQKNRPYDTPVRWGGEEFLILLRATSETSAIAIAERLRLGVEAGFSQSLNIPVTISIGLAQYAHNDTLESLTDRADQALYHAKQTGRNKVVAWSSLPADPAQKKPLPKHSG